MHPHRPENDAKASKAAIRELDAGEVKDVAGGGVIGALPLAATKIEVEVKGDPGCKALMIKGVGAFFGKCDSRDLFEA